MSWLYAIAITTDVIGILVALYFIISDSIRYSRTPSNGSLSLVTMVFTGWVGTSFYLYYHSHPDIASIMAWIPAVPLLGYALMILMFVILKPDMK